jgi:TaqI-like C-terminal specificity domain/Eco57I restriction-modification methylase
MTYIQPFPDWSGTKPSDLQAIIDRLADTRAEELGAVFTRREVVEFILDLAGYRSEENLARASFLEPSFGRGDFLFVALERLLDSYLLHGGTYNIIVPTLCSAVGAVELHRETFMTTRNNILRLLEARGVSKQDSLQLVNTWLLQDDFLLADLPSGFTHIVGNPPYIRQELLPDILLFYYRQRFQTIYDRADLYIPFIERSLSLLAPDGKLAFICPDRWMKNRYGGPLRNLIAKHYHLLYYIDMNNADSFQSNVTAYPAITVITPQRGGQTQVVHNPPLDHISLQKLAKTLVNQDHEQQSSIQSLTNAVDGSRPWLFSRSDEERLLLDHLEKDFPLIEDTGCRIGIGVATGCDDVFIALREYLPIEEDRKLPLLTTSDIQTGRIIWSGKVVINPFKQDGTLVNLEAYPNLKAYFLSREKEIKQRNVAKRNPKAWYRTIDRIYQPLTYQPKLLIPDIKGEPLVVYDAGHYYPHHNLYVITATTWNLQALQALLRSDITTFFIATYSVKMRGGYLRFQAQNLRRIHLPAWESISPSLQARLQDAANSNDIDACNDAAFDLYQLSQQERALLHNLMNRQGHQR